MLYRKQILNVNIDYGHTYKSVLKVIERTLLTDGACHYICTTNPEFIIDAQRDKEFRQIINTADLSLPDGVGVLFANKYYSDVKVIPKNLLFPLKAFLLGITLGVKGLFNLVDLGESIQGVRLTEEILKMCGQKGYTVFFLGGRYRDFIGKDLHTRRDMAHDVLKIVETKYPGIKIIGATSAFTPDGTHDTSTREYIQKCMNRHNVTSIDFLFVAYNHLKQEKWIVRNAHKLSAKISIGVGGTFDYIVGQQQNVPNTMSKFHLGWFYRLIKEPWRLRRTWNAFPKFPWLVYRSSLL